MQMRAYPFWWHGCRTTASYIGLLSCWPVQVPRELYEFPGYPYPDAKMREISGKGFSREPRWPSTSAYS